MEGSAEGGTTAGEVGKVFAVDSDSNWQLSRTQIGWKIAPISAMNAL